MGQIFFWHNTIHSIIPFLNPLMHFCVTTTVHVFWYIIISRIYAEYSIVHTWKKCIAVLCSQKLRYNEICFFFKYDITLNGNDFIFLLLVFLYLLKEYSIAKTWKMTPFLVLYCLHTNNLKIGIATSCLKSVH